MEGVFFHLDQEPGGVRVWLAGGENRRYEFHPYFYVEHSEEAWSALAPKALRVETVEGVDFLAERRFIKVWARDEDHRRRLVRLVKGAREAGVPTWQQFLLETGLEPLSRVTLGEEPEKVGEGGLEDLKVLYISALVYSRDGFPVVGESPVAAVGYAVGDAQPEVIEAGDLDDSSVLREFVDLVGREDPDLIVGYGHDADELKHMMARAAGHGLGFGIGRRGGEPVETGRFFRGMILVEHRVEGRANVDLFSVAWRDFPYLPTKSWYELADEIGVERPPYVQKFRIAERWSSDRDGLLSYLRGRVATVREIARKLLPHQAELGRMTLKPLHEATRSTVGSLVEGLLHRRARERGWVLPAQKKRAGYFPGGYVWLKEPGIYESVGYLDFKSMYPSIMSHFNISAETVEPREGACEASTIEAEGVRKRVCRSPRGLVAETARELMEARSRVKEEMRAVEEGGPEWRRLDALQRAIKVLTNALYGYMGWEGASLYNRDAAELTAALGRKYIKEVADMARRRGLEPIYIDTDGIQLVGGDEEDYERLVEEVNRELPLSIELEYVAERAMYLTKKKYAHLVGGRLIARGFEFVRRDYPPIVKEAQRGAVIMALRGEPLEEIRRRIREYRERLERGEVRKEDLIIIETVGKKLEDFERATKGYHVGVWLREHKGIEIHRGQVLRILIVRGRGSINERARPAEFFDLEDCDIGYYLRLFDQVMERTIKAIRDVRGGAVGLEAFL
ncbi:MAG: hypothetical protein DRO06_00040 [Thermoproteota archaeon]|nr:MAG: hypothetical protein DRO06_00040 [Candidatus Korarchaeota archaeon]